MEAAAAPRTLLLASTTASLLTCGVVLLHLLLSGGGGGGTRVVLARGSGDAGSSSSSSSSSHGFECALAASDGWWQRTEPDVEVARLPPDVAVRNVSNSFSAWGERLLYQWRWHAHPGCDLRRRSAAEIAEVFRGRRLAFVGDSHVRRLRAGARPPPALGRLPLCNRSVPPRLLQPPVLLPALPPPPGRSATSTTTC